MNPNQSVVSLARLACIWEATARKIGNVHPSASFAATEYMHFVASALALRWDYNSLSEGRRIGGLVYEAVRDTNSMVGNNTNLGIILALAPLVSSWPHPTFRESVTSKLQRTNVKDAELVYQAIRLAKPGGLGDAPEQDVRDEPTVTLLDAMKLAADRDLIARQYANGYADVFDFGVPVFLEGLQRFGCVEAAIIHCQLRWLAEYPDSLIARKNGGAVAEDVRRRAAEVQRLGGLATAEGRAAGVALDRHLRADGNRLNPGTVADLIAACLFVALRENKVKPSAPFRWDVPDWLSP